MHMRTFGTKRGGYSVKKILCLVLTVMLMMTSVSALAAKKVKNNYSMETEGYVVLQNVKDRKITPNEGEMDINPLIEGESPTTGMPYDTSARYMPMLVQISNSEATETFDGSLTFTAAEKLARGQELTKDDAKSKKISSAGIGARAPWGGAVCRHRVRRHPVPRRRYPYHLPVQ